ETLGSVRLAHQTGRVAMPLALGVGEVIAGDLLDNLVHMALDDVLLRLLRRKSTNVWWQLYPSDRVVVPVEAGVVLENRQVLRDEYPVPLDPPGRLLHDIGVR